MLCNLKSVKYIRFQFTYERDQNMPPQNMPLWPKDYFLLKAIKKQQTQKELFPLYLLKFPFVKVFPLPSPVPGE